MTTTGAGPAEGPLLSTKLHLPRRRRALLARPRLDALAARSRTRALTLVSAPAGFGKTTLVADWIADWSAAGEATAWLSLDARDDDPMRFWTYVVAALARVVPDLSDDATTLLHTPGTSLEVVVATLINELETAAADLVLVLDDYHVIHQVQVHESVAFLLEHLPPQIRVVIATRADPPLALASLRVDGELLEVRASDLRFTSDEAAEYLNGAMDLTLAVADIDILESRTEGWIAALQLAALSMQGRADPAAFIAGFAGDDRFILDYLADEVLERQRPEVRQFLLDTSILSRLTAPLCAAVAGADDARAMLEELDRSNLFLIALDDRRSWYRYHHLFGDVLRARLVDGHADRVPLLHGRASDWYAAHGDPQEAVVHAMAAGDLSRAADLIEQAALEMHRARQEGVLRGWLESLPTSTYADRPVLMMLLVGARMSTGDVTGVERLLDRIEAMLDDPSGCASVYADQEGYDRLPAMIAVHRAGAALLAGDIDETIVQASRVLDVVDESDTRHRGAAAALLGLAHWAQGDLDAARERYIESVGCFELGNFLPDFMGCSLALADIQLTQGRLRDAQHTFEAALQHCALDPSLRGAADMHVGMSLLAIEQDDLEAAAHHLRASAELGEPMGLPQHPYRWRAATARMHRANGDLEAALQLLTEAEARYTTDYSPDVRPVAATRAALQVEMGDIEAGVRWATDRGLAPDDDLAYVGEYEHLVLAKVLTARGAPGDGERAVSLLRRLLEGADVGHRAGSALEIRIALAIALDRAGDERGASDAMDEAIQQGTSAGYVRTFLDADPIALRIVRRLGGEAGAKAAGLLESEATDRTRPRPRPARPDELSERELDVLRLLRSDLSGPDIARELHVSLNTLRTHTKHIYTKLGATNRREALSRAAELGL